MDIKNLIKGETYYYPIIHYKIESLVYLNDFIFINEDDEKKKLHIISIENYLFETFDKAEIKLYQMSLKAKQLDISVNKMSINEAEEKIKKYKKNEIQLIKDLDDICKKFAHLENKYPEEFI